MSASATATPRSLLKLRTLCLALPDTFEKLSHGAPAFWSPKRVFATFADAGTHHGKGRHAAWVLAAKGRQERMVRTAPDRFFAPPYVGVYGWIGVWLDEVCDWTELADILASAQSEAQGPPKRRYVKAAR
jgi:hypothetical protein